MTDQETTVEKAPTSLVDDILADFFERLRVQACMEPEVIEALKTAVQQGKLKDIKTLENIVLPKA
jgi:hypothetical protein